MTNSTAGLLQHFTNKLLDTGTVLFHRPIWKNKTHLCYSETFDLETQSGWTSLPCFLLILYPCFLIYFSEAPLTLPRCVSVSLTENVVRMCQEEWRRGRRRTRGKNKRQSVIMTSVRFTLKRIYNLTHFNFNCRECRHNMAAIQQRHSQKVPNSNTSSPAFFTSTLMFRLLPMVTFNIQYFTLSFAIETCGELCAMVHRQSGADTQCRLKGCGGFTAGRHFYTAWLQWVCVASWDKTENLNRRCSLVLMSHAFAKNPLTLLTLCFFARAAWK